MEPRTQGILLTLLMISLSLVFQVQMKQFATALNPLLAKADGVLGILGALAQVALSWRALAIVALAGSLFLLWLLCLTRLELSFALPVAAIAFIVNAVGGGLWLGENLSWLRLGGIMTTAIGIILVINS